MCNCFKEAPLWGERVVGPHDTYDTALGQHDNYDIGNGVLAGVLWSRA